MLYARYIAFAFALLLAGCGGMTDDLNPSGADNRVSSSSATGGDVGQDAPAFTVSDSQGNSVTLAATLNGKDAAVFYFTMWCPVCDSHMQHILGGPAADYPNVAFYAVDYVSGTVAEVRAAEVSSGYAGTAFTVLADVDDTLQGIFNGTMGVTVAVKADGSVLMNEDYKDGSRLDDILGAL